MTHSRLLATSFAISIALSACTSEQAPSSTPGENLNDVLTTQSMVEQMLDGMGGRAALERIDTIEFRGDGTRTRLGQIPQTGGQDPMGTLTGVTETIDLANERAAMDYDVSVDGFGQHRTEALTTFEGVRLGWGTTVGRPNIVTSVNGLFSWGTQNSPEMLLRRNVVTIALAAARSVAPNEVAQMRRFDGRTLPSGTARLASNEPIELYFDPDTALLAGFAALDTESMLGDVEAEYVFADYRRVDGVNLPHSITITKDDRPFSSLGISSIAINDPNSLAIFAIPNEVTGQAESVIATDGAWAPLEWNEVAENVFHAVAFSHHSMVVEFPTFVAVVEGPYTEAQSLSLDRVVDQETGKPIRYVAPTHPHYDHTGGIRGLAAVGASIIVAEGHEAELRGIVESPHTNPPDELSRRESAGAEVGTVEVFSGMTVIEEGDQRLELYEVHTIPHVNPKVLAYVPTTGTLFQSDLFFGGPGPDAAALFAAVNQLGLEVETIVGGHGGTLPFAALVEAANDSGE